MLGLVPPHDHGEERCLLVPLRAWGGVLFRDWLGEWWATTTNLRPRAAGLDGLRIHDLRHTAVALWIAAGANPTEVAARAGMPR
jgi:integrase